MLELQSSDPEPVSNDSRRARGTVGLVLLFGTMYFVQGIAEPTEGLIAQPVRSLLASWGRSAAEIAAFGAHLALPWWFKPLYGLLSDFVPLFGTRRRSYLLLTTTITFLGLGYLYFAEPPRGNTGMLLTLLLLPTLGVAFSDVVIDALMVEKGQPLGLTGMLQSAQWTAMYAGMIVAGQLGGYLSQNNRQYVAFLICAVVTFVTLVLTWFFVPERPRPRPQSGLAEALSGLGTAVKSPAVLSCGIVRDPVELQPVQHVSLVFLHDAGTRIERAILRHDRLAAVSRCDVREPRLRHLLPTVVLHHIDPPVHRVRHSEHAGVLGHVRQAVCGGDQCRRRIHVHDGESRPVRYGRARLSAQGGRNHVRLADGADQREHVAIRVPRRLVLRQLEQPLGTDDGVQSAGPGRRIDQCRLLARRAVVEGQAEVSVFSSAFR